MNDERNGGKRKFPRAAAVGAVAVIGGVTGVATGVLRPQDLAGALPFLSGGGPGGGKGSGTETAPDVHDYDLWRNISSFVSEHGQTLVAAGIIAIIAGGLLRIFSSRSNSVSA